MSRLTLPLVALLVAWPPLGCGASSSSLAGPQASPKTDEDPYTFCGVSLFAWTHHGVVARGAQPSARALKCLHEAGFRAVVNLRKEDVGFNEKAVVEDLGMSYLHLSIPDDTAPSPLQIRQYLEFVETQQSSQSPVFTHDAAGRGRMGVMDGVYLLTIGWSTGDVFKRYVDFGAKLDCSNGGNGQVQALHEIGLVLGRGDAWPLGLDRSGRRWENCPRPHYMKSWNYNTISLKPTENRMPRRSLQGAVPY